MDNTFKVGEVERQQGPKGPRNRTCKQENESDEQAQVKKPINFI